VESLIDSFDGDREATQKALDKSRQLQRDIESSFPDPGTMGLPKLLDAKRVKYGIPASAWSSQAVFNKILVWQLPIDEAATYGGGLIVKTDERKARERNEAPRGVIVSAGLQALDELRSHGVDIGHTVHFTHTAPFRKRLPSIAGKEPSLVILHSGDIFDSEELADNLRARKCRIVDRVVNGVTEHFYCDENGKSWTPAQDVPSEDS
jgi:hypothetical protein